MDGERRNGTAKSLPSTPIGGREPWGNAPASGTFWRSGHAFVVGERKCPCLLVEIPRVTSNAKTAARPSAATKSTHARTPRGVGWASAHADRSHHINRMG